MPSPTPADCALAPTCSHRVRCLLQPGLVDTWSLARVALWRVAMSPTKLTHGTSGGPRNSAHGTGYFSTWCFWSFHLRSDFLRNSWSLHSPF